MSDNFVMEFLWKNDITVIESQMEETLQTASLICKNAKQKRDKHILADSAVVKCKCQP